MLVSGGNSIHIEGCNGFHGFGFIGPDREKKCLNGVISVTRVLRVTRYEAGSRQVSRFHWRRIVDVTTTKGERNSFSHFPEKTRVFFREAISRAILIFLHFSPSNRRRSVSSKRIGQCRVNFPLDRSVLMSISGVLKLGFKLDFGGFDSRVPNRHLGYILGKIEPFSCRLVEYWR